MGSLGGEVWAWAWRRATKTRGRSWSASGGVALITRVGESVKTSGLEINAFTIAN